MFLLSTAKSTTARLESYWRYALQRPLSRGFAFMSPGKLHVRRVPRDRRTITATAKTITDAEPVSLGMGTLIFCSNFRKFWKSAVCIAPLVLDVLKDVSRKFQES